MQDVVAEKGPDRCGHPARSQHFRLRNMCRKRVARRSESRASSAQYPFV